MQLSKEGEHRFVIDDKIIVTSYCFICFLKEAPQIRTVSSLDGQEGIAQNEGTMYVPLGISHSRIKVEILDPQKERNNENHKG